MAERRQLPVEDREQARRVCVEDHVVDAPVAVNQRDPAVVRRDFVGKPGDEALHVLDPFRFAGPVLIGPALVLASVVAAGLAVIREARCGDVDRVQPGQTLVHGVVDRPAILALELGQRRVPEDASVDERHQIEGGSDHALVLAER